MRNPPYARSSAPSTKNIAGTYPAGSLVYVRGVQVAPEEQATLCSGARSWTSQRNIEGRRLTQPRSMVSEKKLSILRIQPGIEKMRSLVSFLVGLVIGAAAILFLPDIRRENLNTELRGQIQALQKQIQELGGQLKDIKL